jgi:hypothetical protein
MQIDEFIVAELLLLATYRGSLVELDWTDRHSGALHLKEE